MTLGRIDLFWMGAGGFLTLFGANEIIAYASHPVPRWLGGPLALAGEIVAVSIGLSVMYGLGLREAVEVDPAAVAPASEGATDSGTEGSSSSDLRRARGSVSSSSWPRSSTNSKP